MVDNYFDNTYASVKKSLQISIDNTEIIEIKNVYLDNNTFSQNIYHKIYSIFTPKFILNSTQYEYKNLSIIKFKCLNIYINLFYFIKDTLDPLDILIMIIKANTFINLYGSNEVINRKEIEIYYIPTLFKKIMNKKHFLGPEHVNSGFTLHDSHIVIYRKEEAHKVLIHELVHYFELDFSYYSCLPEICNNITNDFDVITDQNFINIFEAYTDFIAIIYNLILNSILFQVSFYDLIDIEIYYQKCLITKILKKFSMTHICKDLNLSDNKLIQKSNVLSYYFIKYPLISNYKIILDKYKLGTAWNEYKILEFYNFTLYHLRKKKNLLYKNLMNNSLRMTYLF